MKSAATFKCIEMLRTALLRPVGSNRGLVRFCSQNSFKPLETKEEIEQLFSSPTWDINEFFKPAGNAETKISNESIKKLLNLSGLDNTALSNEEIAKNLNDQILFINKLQNLPNSEANDDILKNQSSSCASSPLSYQDLLSSIKNQTPELEKGEIGDSWTPTDLSKSSQNGFFVVNEGLNKSS